MKAKIFLFILFGLPLMVSAQTLVENYDGAPLEWDDTFSRKRVGVISADTTLAEISGVACSRVTPGYLWIQSDESSKVCAVTPRGDRISTIRVANSYRDWEDLCGGIYNDTNYLFVGIFGDNDLRYNNQYYIYYFKEPEVVQGTIKVDVDTIHFGYPDNKPHNAETLMFDNVEKVLYVVDKYSSANSMGVVYSLPFRTDYKGMQVLEEECKLGNDVNFKNPTGGDISPDGKYIIVKSEAFMLMWLREEGESVAEAMRRRPKQVKAYKTERQGEAIAWQDSTTFYTTNDTYSGTASVYMYTKVDPTGLENLKHEHNSTIYKTLNTENHMVLIHHEGKVYSLLGNIIE